MSKGHNLKNIVENLAQPGVILTGDKLSFINQYFCIFSGFRSEILKQKFFTGLFFNTDHTPADIKKIISQGQPKYMLFKHRSGSFTRIVINIAPLKDAGKSVVATLTDLSKTGPFLYPELNDYNLFKNSPMGIIYFDDKFTVQRINHTALKMFNLQENSRITPNEFISPQSFDLFKEIFERVLATQKSEEVVLNCIKDKDNILYCKWTLVASKNLSEKMVLAYISDITGIKQTEHKLSREKTKAEAANLKLKKAVRKARKLAAEVTYANNSKAAFIANISHEIRTPLNAIMGFSEILAREISDPQKLKFLNSIIKSGNSLLEIINSILDYSKLEAGKKEINISEINTRRFLQKVTHVTQNICFQKGLGFYLFIDDETPEYLELDQQLLTQIIRNLLDNAVKFTKKGKIELHINTEKEDENYINLGIQVKDTGIGIPDDQKEKVFSPFSQKDNQSHATYGGTGLGLSIVKKSVSLLAGELRMSSKLNEGTEFYIKLPHINVINNKNKIAESELKNIAIEQIAFENQRLLIVDKTEFNRVLIKNLLSDYDFDINETETVDNIYSSLHENQRDLLIISETIVFQLGENQLSKLIHHVNNQELPVIILGTKEKNNTAVYHKIRRYARVEKPVQKKELVSVLAGLLNYQQKKILHPDAEQNIVPKTMPRERIRRMLKFLEIEFLPKCKKYHENLVINDIEDLCREVALVAEKNNIWILINWTRKLKSALDNFEIINIKQLLKEFPNILEEISLIIN